MRFPRTAIGCVLASMIGLAGCDRGEAAPWQVVAVADLSALGAADELSFWWPSAGMEASCGPAKGPLGIGIPEAQAMAHGLMPTLAIVLESTGYEDRPPLDREQVQLLLGELDEPFFLEPAVVPRHVTVALEETWDGVVRAAEQRVERQIERGLCLEHKLGRAWIGGQGDDLRQALLIDPPEGLGGQDRRYFSGQSDPVPALLGPPDACWRGEYPQHDATLGTRGAGSLSIQMSDVWGASLRSCDPVATVGAGVLDSREMPLAVPGSSAQAADRRWQGLSATMEGDAPTAMSISATWDGGFGPEHLLVHEPLAPSIPLVDAEDPTEAATRGGGDIDLLARVPYRYPVVFGSDGAPHVALLVPGWQLEEGMRRVYGLGDTLPDDVDAVAWTLGNLDRTQLRIRSDEAEDTWIRVPTGSALGAVFPTAMAEPSAVAPAVILAASTGEGSPAAARLGFAVRRSLVIAGLLAIVCLVGLGLAGLPARRGAPPSRWWETGPRQGGARP